QGEASGCDQDPPAGELERQFRHIAERAPEIVTSGHAFAPDQRQLIETALAGVLIRSQGRFSFSLALSRGLDTIPMSTTPADRCNATATEDPAGAAARPRRPCEPNAAPASFRFVPERR